MKECDCQVSPRSWCPVFVAGCEWFITGRYLIAVVVVVVVVERGPTADDVGDEQRLQ